MGLELVSDLKVQRYVRAFEASWQENLFSCIYDPCPDISS